MEIASNSSSTLTFHTSVTIKNPTFDLNKTVFGLPVFANGVSKSAGQVKKRCKYTRLRVHAVAEVSTEKVSNKSLDLLGFDVIAEGELREKGFLGMRKTKLVCTIGPACSSSEDLERLAMGGMNVARLNMCHGTRDWHRNVIRRIKKLNKERGYCVSVMIDTEGSQIHGPKIHCHEEEPVKWRYNKAWEQFIDENQREPLRCLQR